MSLQEAQEAGARASAETSNIIPAPTETAAILPGAVTAPLHNANDSDVPMAPGDATQPIDPDDEVLDEAEMRRRAALLGRAGEDVVMAEDGDEEEDEEAAIARAIAMSLEEGKGGEDDKK